VSVCPFFDFIHHIDGARCIMFSFCPSVCSYIYQCMPGHSLTGLPLTSSFPNVNVVSQLEGEAEDCKMAMWGLQ